MQDNISDAEIIDAYNILKSTYKVAAKYNLTRHEVKKRLRKHGKLRSQQQAAKERDNSHCGKYERTPEIRKKYSDYAKGYIGEKNPFYGKKHSEETKKVISERSKKAIGSLNGNWKGGKTPPRRPRDFKLYEFKPLRNFALNRDNYKCHYCKEKKDHMHVHHIIPFWACNSAFLDIENLVTVCRQCHYEKAHKGNWWDFDFSLLTDTLKKRYNLQRERLNELAAKIAEAIVRPSDINETDESSRND